MSCYQFIDQLAVTEPVQVLCWVLQVSLAGYYQWVRRPGKSATAWQAAAAACQAVRAPLWNPALARRVAG